jgi:broad specificity phosphatase PhoE
MQLLLIRHGETDWNVQKRIQGWGNSQLTERGKNQIRLLGDRLQDTPLAAVYASTSERAQLTGSAILRGRDLLLAVLPGLRETSWGEWEGKTSAEISALEPELWASFVRRGHENPSDSEVDWEATTLVPGGENQQQASLRINSCVDEIVAQHINTNQWIAVIGHGGSLRFVVAALLGLRPAASRRFHLDNASLTHISIDSERIVLNLLNDTSHWSGGKIP